jgi:hypothetical protein
MTQSEQETSMTQTTRAGGLAAIPLFGPLISFFSHGEGLIWLGILVLALIVVLAVLLFGAVGLAMSALALVPVMFTLLMAITRG